MQVHGRRGQWYFFSPFFPRYKEKNERNFEDKNAIKLGPKKKIFCINDFFFNSQNMHYYLHWLCIDRIFFPEWIVLVYEKEIFKARKGKICNLYKFNYIRIFKTQGSRIFTKMAWINNILYFSVKYVVSKSFRQHQ